MSLPTPEATRGPLSPPERRVLGGLSEKQKTTPEYYPMSSQGIATACNQKSNRDPITNYDAEDVEAVLQGLRKRGAAILVEGSGRVTKWKHNLYEWLDLRHKPEEMAILAELMLRGAQTEGELRGRASRMDPIPDLATLQAKLEFLETKGYVIYLSPRGQKRGVVVTHGFYPPNELERVKLAGAAIAAAAEERTPLGSVSPPATSPPQPDPAWIEEVEQLRGELKSLRGLVESLAGEIRTLKEALGA
ncbi:MAG: DUF480 domain-containing protein [Isosphaeraceae bacterium]